jgi:hypothetical protein
MDQYGLGSTFYSNSTDTEPWTTVQYCGSKLPVVWYCSTPSGTMALCSAVSLSAIVVLLVLPVEYECCTKHSYSEFQ